LAALSRQRVRKESKSKTITEFLEKSIFQGTILMILTMIFSFFYLNLAPEKAILLGVCGFFVPFGVNYIIVDLIFDRKGWLEAGNNKRWIKSC
jgi:hypothetical protein